MVSTGGRDAEYPPWYLRRTVLVPLASDRLRALVHLGRDGPLVATERGFLPGRTWIGAGGPEPVRQRKKRVYHE